MDVVSSTNIPKYYENFFSVKGKFSPDKLLNMPSVNLNDNQGDVAGLEKLEDAKAKLRNVDTIELSARWIKKLNCDNQQLILIDYDKPIDYYQFDGFINGIEGLSKEQTATIKNSVLTATESERRSIYEGKYSISFAQTDFELKFISKNLIPEKYQKDFNSIIEKYTEGLYKKMNASTEDSARSLINTQDPSLINSGWIQKGYEILKSVQNGTHISQTTTGIYSGLYKNIENSNSTDIKENLDSVFNDIIKNGVTYNKGSATEQSLISDVKFLKEKWNSVVYAMGNYNHLMFKTSINDLA